jgi:hypothetical protein
MSLKGSPLEWGFQDQWVFQAFFNPFFNHIFFTSQGKNIFFVASLNVKLGHIHS